MSKLPIIDSKNFEKILLKLGFVYQTKRKSRVLQTSGWTTLPHHGRDISRPLVRQILKEIKLTPEEFTTILEKV